jgi:hypothetical protein
MKASLALLSVLALGASVAACGSSSATDSSRDASHNVSTEESATSTAEEAPADYRKADADKDNDIGAPYDDRNNHEALSYGHAADASDERTILDLVKRYYVTALAGNGAKACSLLYSPLAEAAPEDYGEVPGPTYLRGANTCKAVLTRLFRHFHSQLAVQVRVLRVRHVRIQSGHAVALLSFAGMPERELQITREGHVWKIAALLDGPLP